MSESLTTFERPTSYETETQIKLNNNPLAHVNLLLQGYGDKTTEERIKLEFMTDMGERLENQPFCSSYHYTYDGREIVYDTGILYLESLKNSCIAARQDVASGAFPQYHLDRQIAFSEQGQIIKNWLDDTCDNRHLLLLSLCPTEHELSKSEAKKQSFKPDRQMASIQLHVKNSDGSANSIAFSLDGLTPERLQELFDKLGVDAIAATDTMTQLTLPVYIDDSFEASDAVTKIISSYDQLLYEATGKLHQQGIDINRNIVEANSFVSQHPEAYQLYRDIVSEVALSLRTNAVTPGLHNLVYQGLAQPYINKSANIPLAIQLETGGYFNKTKASRLIEYLRAKAIPEYLTQKLENPHDYKSRHTTHNSVSDGGGITIGSAGVDAQISGKTYDGGCPTSSQSTTTNQNNSLSATEQAKQMGLNKNVIVKYQYQKGYCVVPNCPSAKLDFKVMVGPCSVCRDCQENLYDKGVDAVKYYEKSFFEIISEMCEAIFNEVFCTKDDLVEENSRSEPLDKDGKPIKILAYGNSNDKVEKQKTDYDLAA